MSGFSCVARRISNKDWVASPKTTCIFNFSLAMSAVYPIKKKKKKNFSLAIMIYLAWCNVLIFEWPFLKRNVDWDIIFWQKLHFRPYIFSQFSLWSIYFIFIAFSPYPEKRFPFWSLSLHQKRKMHTWQTTELKNIKIMSTCHCKLHVAFPPLVSPIPACRRSRGPHLTL